MDQNEARISPVSNISLALLMDFPPFFCLAFLIPCRMKNARLLKRQTHNAISVKSQYVAQHPWTGNYTFQWCYKQNIDIILFTWQLTPSCAKKTDNPVCATVKWQPQPVYPASIAVMKVCIPWRCTYSMNTPKWKLL